MANDQLFHKRKAYKANELHRREAQKSPYEVILIVCEGEKTETNYFKGLREKLRLNRANIQIAEDVHGSAPRNIVDFAIAKHDNSTKEDKFDHIYCVIDRDKHTTFNEAIRRIDAKNEQQLANTREDKTTFHAIFSVPCFEVWILLHHEYTTIEFCAAARASNCDMVIRKLKTVDKSYKKGDTDIFIKIENKTTTAIANAKRLEQHHNGICTEYPPNPSTKVHELVEKLLQIRA